MSKQALDAFKAKLATDAALREEMTRVLSRDGQQSNASAQDLAAFAQSRGYDLSAEDVRATMELSDDQLESVAGGVLISGSTDLSYTQSYSVESISLNFSKISIDYKEQKV
jgi:predicted ribosomally synthesized peptide with nif11-like leader